MLAGPAAAGPWAAGTGAARAWFVQAEHVALHAPPSVGGAAASSRALPQPTWAVPGLGLNWPFGGAAGVQAGSPRGLGGLWRLFTGSGPQRAQTTTHPQAASSEPASAQRPVSNSPASQPSAATGTGQAESVTSAYPPFSLGRWGAGYVAYAPQGQKFTEVSAVFVLPAAPAPGTAPSGGGAAWVSIWTGIGISAKGATQLMQAGVSMQAENGAWSYSAPWWINESSAAPPPHPMQVAVSPGDRIAVDVRLSDATANTWTFTVTDETTGQSETDQCAGCVSGQDTAGWVVEDPSFSQQYTDFADPGTVTFLSAEAAVAGGPLQPLPATQWRTLLRQAGGGSEQGPLAAPGGGGGFSVGDLAGAAAGPAANAGA